MNVLLAAIFALIITSIVVFVYERIKMSREGYSSAIGKVRQESND